MSIPIQGIASRSGGIMSAIAKQVRMVNLKPVDKITVKFDPFEERSRYARNFLHYITAKKTQSTNLFCLLKANVVCDGSHPTVTCDLTSGEKIVFDCDHLVTLDILKLYNQHISSQVPIEEPPETGRPKKKKKLRIKKKIPRKRQ